MPKDKQLHLLCGFAIGLISLPLAVLAGAGKEVYDYYHQDKHSVEFADFAYTACGGAIAETLVCICKILIA